MTDDRKFGLRFDGTINIGTIGAIIAAVVAGATWVNSVNNKLDTMAQLVVETGSMGKRMDDLEREILLNRGETLKNREVSRQVLEEVK